MKKIYLLLTLIICLVFMVSCSENQTGSTSMENAVGTSQQITNTPTTMHQQTTTTIPQQENTVPSASPSNPNPDDNPLGLSADERMNYARYRSGSNDGYAWIEQDEVYYCISAQTGEIVYSCSIFEEGGKQYQCWPVTKVSHDCVMLYGNGNQYILANIQTGETVFTVNNLEITGIAGMHNLSPVVHMGDMAPRLLETGRLLVYTIVETYSSVSYQFGIVDLNGNWIAELSADHPILAPTKNSEYFLTETFTYLGEGKYLVVYTDRWGEFLSYGIYDLYSNTMSDKLFEVESNGCFAMAHELQSVTMRDGQITFLFGDHLFSVSEKGEVVKKKANKRYDYLFAINEDFFVDGDNLYSRDGKKIRYVGGWIIHAWVNGIALIEIPDASGSPFGSYVALMDKTGAFLFEPFKVGQNASISCLDYDGEYLIVCEYGNPAEIYDINGVLLAQIEGHYILENGIAYQYETELYIPVEELIQQAT